MGGHDEEYRNCVAGLGPSARVGGEFDKEMRHMVEREPRNRLMNGHKGGDARGVSEKEERVAHIDVRK